MHVVRLQAKRIQPYLSSSPRLRHVVGASELVERSARELADTTAERFGGKRLGGGAGQAWLSFPDQSGADAFQRIWPLVVDTFAPGLRFAVASVAYPDTGARECAESLATLMSALRASANAPSAPVPEFSPLVERSPETGAGAVRWERGRGRGSEGRLLDLQTSRKVRATDAAGQRLSRMLETPAGLEWPTRFDEIAGEDDLAVIHADGNGLGELIRRLIEREKGDPLQLSLAMSNAVSSSTVAAARRAARVLYEDVGGSGTIPGRPLVLGGDDFSFVVRGRLAGPFVRTFLQAFEEESSTAFRALRADSSDFLTACAGVALVRGSFPFLQAYQLAESACSWAKERARGSRPQDAQVPSALVFHRATTSLVGAYEDLLAGELQGDGVTLAHGPYAVSRRVNCSLSTLEELEQLAAVLEGLPRGAVRGVVGELRRSRDEARRRWERALTVAGGRTADEVRAAFRAVTADRRGLAEACRNPLLDALVWRRLRPAQAAVEA